MRIIAEMGFEMSLLELQSATLPYISSKEKIYERMHGLMRNFIEDRYGISGRLQMDLASMNRNLYDPMKECFIINVMGGNEDYGNCI